MECSRDTMWRACLKAQDCTVQDLSKIKTSENLEAGRDENAAPYNAWYDYLKSRGVEKICGCQGTDIVAFIQMLWALSFYRQGPEEYIWWTKKYPPQWNDADHFKNQRVMTGSPRSCISLSIIKKKSLCGDMPTQNLLLHTSTKQQTSSSKRASTWPDLWKARVLRKTRASRLRKNT